LDQSQPDRGRMEYVIGFNQRVDRAAVTHLVGMVQGAMVAGATDLTICITSRGGDYAQAAYAYEVLSGMSVPTAMHAIGTVRLSAVTLFMAGTRRYAAAGTDFLLGETLGGLPSSLERQEVVALDEVGRVDCLDRLAIERIASRTARTAEEIAEWIGRKRFLDAQFALDQGIVHEIRPLRIPSGAVFLQIPEGQGP